MKTTRTKGLLAAVAALALAGSLAACGGSSSSDTAEGGPEGWRPNDGRPEGEIHVLVLGDAAASAEQAAADRFNETSDIKVVVDTGPTAGTEYNTTVRTQMGTDSAPDVFMSWGAAGIEPLIKAQALLPLDDFIAEQPKLQDMFVPSVFEEEVVDDSAYGIPMRGVAPEFLYYNTKVLEDAGLEPATTWDELMDQVPTLQDAGVIPIGLAGADKWPEQIWLQYVYARMVGNDAVAQGLAGDTDVWASDESKAALADLQDLIDSGAFGSNFASVSYGGDGSAALLRQGKSAYELMGSWHYATVGDSSNLGWVAFPTMDGGSGQPGEIVGNLSNFYNVAADTRYPDAVRGFLEELYSPEFQQDEIGLGNLPPTTDAADYVESDADLDASAKEHLTFVSGLVNDAPTFQLSWDQTVPATQQTASQDAAADFFNGTIDADGFVSAMQDVVSAD
ncbi:ABC transporter substrate-binding protein [Nocardioides bruguierae]|uniref:ABC transporter substrate-binding protein n=1 Tax=Nocardioides bruguierae TaxID=2945102 RepID=UPI0020216BAF|nr:extracellular solute-binding protein [Nocardioides bruguierae]MCL8025306.1 extracellular solute-binding protein [Nocardioides bruguierae]